MMSTWWTWLHRACWWLEDPPAQHQRLRTSLTDYFHSLERVVGRLLHTIRWQQTTLRWIIITLSLLTWTGAGFHGRGLPSKMESDAPQYWSWGRFDKGRDGGQSLIWLCLSSLECRPPAAKTTLLGLPTYPQMRGPRKSSWIRIVRWVLRIKLMIIMKAPLCVLYLIQAKESVIKLLTGPN